MTNNNDFCVMTDIHGQSKLLNVVLKKLKEEGVKKVIFLGDYIDRGPDSLGVLNTIIDNDYGFEFITLKGNHEDMLGVNLDNPYFYCANFQTEFENNNGFTETQKDFIKNKLKKFHFEGKNVFVHAAYDGSKPPEYQNDNVLFWHRYLWREKFNSNDMFLTHGHTPQVNKLFPEKLENKLNLDMGAMFGKVLGVGYFNNKHFGPLKFKLFSNEGEVLNEVAY